MCWNRRLGEVERPRAKAWNPSKGPIRLDLHSLLAEGVADQRLQNDSTAVIEYLDDDENFETVGKSTFPARQGSQGGLELVPIPAAGLSSSRSRSTMRRPRPMLIWE